MVEKSIKKNAFYSFLKAFMTLIFPIITFPYASRILLPEGIGKVNFANSIISYFVMLGSLGIGTYGTREIAKNKENKLEVSKILKELLLINFITTLIATVLFVFSFFFIKQFKEYQSILLICSLNIVFTPLGLDWYYRGLEEFKYITVRSFLFQLLSVIFLFTFVKTEDDLLLYTLIGIISSVGSNICNIIHARKSVFLKIDSKLELKKHLKPILIFFASSVSISIYTMLDTSMIGFLSNDNQVGLYSAANKINRMLLGVITATIGVILSRLSFYNNQNKKEEFYNLANKCFRYILIVSVPCAVGLFLLSKPIILLFSGSQYVEAVDTMKILSPIIVIISIGVFLNGNILPSLGKEKYGLIAVTSGAIINFVLNIFFIKKWQAFGAGLSTLITEFSITLIQLFFTRKIFINKENLITLIKVVIATIVMFAILEIVYRKFNMPIFQIVICMISGIFIYSCLLFLLREKEFINLIKLKVFSRNKI